MSADEPEKPGVPLEGSEEELFDELVAGYRVKPQALPESSGAAEAAYTHGPRAPKHLVDTLPPNQDPPVVLNITQPLTVLPRIVEAEPPPTEGPSRSYEDNLTFPIPERRTRQRRGKVVAAAVVLVGLFAFGLVVRWRTIESVTPAAQTPTAGTAAMITAPTVAASVMSAPAIATAPPTSFASPTPATAMAVPSSTTTASAPPPVVRPIVTPPARPTTVVTPPVTAAPPSSPVPAPSPTVPAPAPAPASTAKPKDDVSRTF